MSLIIAIDIAAFNISTEVSIIIMNSDLFEETTFIIIDYADLREHYVFTKRPVRIILKTDVLSTWRT